MVYTISRIDCSRDTYVTGTCKAGKNQTYADLHHLSTDFTHQYFSRYATRDE